MNVYVLSYAVYILHAIPSLFAKDLHALLPLSLLVDVRVAVRAVHASPRKLI